MKQICKMNHLIKKLCSCFMVQEAQSDEVSDVLVYKDDSAGSMNRNQIPSTSINHRDESSTYPKVIDKWSVKNLDSSLHKMNKNVCSHDQSRSYSCQYCWETHPNHRSKFVSFNQLSCLLPPKVKLSHCRLEDIPEVSKKD